MSFDTLNLNPKLLKAVEQQGYTEPTEIQSQAIPYLLESNDDFVGQAQTGTGKTAAFVLPLLQRLQGSKSPIQALVLTPTRELAKQIEQEIEIFSKHISVKTVLVYGGAPYTKQIDAIKKQKPAIVVGTPGRVIDLMKKGILDFSSSKQLILDEADEMLNMGFWEDIETILDSFNPDRSLWMFSATMPPPILKLIRSKFNNPKVVKTNNKGLSNEDIEQSFYLVERRNKLEALHRLILQQEPESAVIFCRTRVETTELAQNLASRGLKVECLNGDMAQNQREIAMKRFKNNKVQLLVCTDVAARGIDVSGLTHVYNFGLPQDCESYVHRIGRTGRAGKTGMAVSIVAPSEMGMLRRIENLIKKRVDKKNIPSLSSLKNKLVENQSQRIMRILASMVEKGEDFQIDPAYQIFQKSFEEFSKEQLQKAFFTMTFNKEFHQLGQLGELTVRKSRMGGPGENARGRSARRDGRDRRRSGNSRSTSSRGRSGGRRRNYSQ